MKAIRQNVFETNSSSTHSICVAKDIQYTLPETLHFCLGDFGWKQDTLSSNYQKASYLYTALMQANRHEQFEQIIALLESKGVEVTFEKPEYCSYGEYSYLDNGNIDHLEGGLFNLMNDVRNEDVLMRFLFSPLSYILTGNDNADHDVNIKVTYPHTAYYKGN